MDSLFYKHHGLKHANNYSLCDALSLYGTAALSRRMCIKIFGSRFRGWGCAVYIFTRAHRVVVLMILVASAY